jgi:AAA domain (dynein-related subfamily)
VPDPDAAERLRELRLAWNIPDAGPLVAVGRLRGRLRDGVLRDNGTPLPDILFLEELEHPGNGVGLVYPTTGETKAANAFVPPWDAHAYLSREAAASGHYWAIGELELSPPAEREKRGNPWLCSIRPGTLRLLSELPEEWHIVVNGPISARRIATSARDEIELHVRQQILREDGELALRDERNRQTIARIQAESEDAKNKAQETRSQHDAEIEAARLRSDTAQKRARELESQLRSESARFDEFRQNIERETQIMDNRYRQLSELLSEKGHRLLALGLVDEDDLALLLPEAQPDDQAPRLGLAEALEGDFARLAPLIQVKLAHKGLMYSQARLRDFLALLRTRDLVVLAGDSGSGKTSLVTAVAEAVGAKAKVIPVKPNWTGPEDLLGYFNPIERSYHSTPFLDALQAAAREPHVPHFICLDEMNLARVEHYFADFLSLLENRASPPEILLYTADEERHVVVEQALFLGLEAEARRRAGLGEDAGLEDVLKDDKANEALRRLGGFSDKESVLLHYSRLRRSLSAQIRMPTRLRFPSNVWIFGAVNMDETTHHLSPKVLDRVHILRFRNPMLADWDEIEAEIAGVQEDAKRPLQLTTDDFGHRADYPAFDRHDENVAFLAQLARRQLDPLGIEFGLRAIRQSVGYIQAAGTVGIPTPAALDNVVKHKILPKIAFDTNRPAADGRKRREILLELRTELAARFGQLDPGAGEENSVAVLDRLIDLADGNNGVANYWLR